MKDFLLDPLNFFVICLASLAYFYVVFELAKRAKFSSLLHSFVVLVILISIPGTRTFPIVRMNLSWLIHPSLNALALLIFYMLIGIILNQQSRYFFKYFFEFIFRRDPALGLLLTLLVLSATWSAIPAITLRYSLALLFTSAIAIYIGSIYDLNQVNFFIRASSLIIGVLSIFQLIVNPSDAYLGRGLRGVLIHPNIFGPYIAFATAVWLVYLLKNLHKPLLSAAVIVVFVFLVLATNSAGAFANFIVVIFLTLLFAFSKHFTNRQVIIASFFVLAASLISFTWLTNNVGDFFGLLGRDSTLTGRTDIWQSIVRLIQERPFLGYGYRSIWLDPSGPPASIKTDSGFRPVESHNGIFELGLDVGIIGIVLFSISFFGNFYKALKIQIEERNLDIVAPLVFLVFLAMANTAESRLVKVDYAWFYYVLFVTSINKIAEANLNKSNLQVREIEDENRYSGWSISRSVPNLYLKSNHRSN